MELLSKIGNAILKAVFVIGYIAIRLILTAIPIAIAILIIIRLF